MCMTCADKVGVALKARRLKRRMKPTHGVKKEGGTFDVVANSGRPMGRYRTRAQANKRVREIEYFKHHPGA